MKLCINFGSKVSVSTHLQCFYTIMFLVDASGQAKSSIVGKTPSELNSKHGLLCHFS